MKEKAITVPPLIRLACHPADQGRLMEDTSVPPEPMALPEVGDVLTLRQMLDPHTRLPVPVRVAEVTLYGEGKDRRLVVVLTRDQ